MRKKAVIPNIHLLDKNFIKRLENVQNRDYVEVSCNGCGNKHKKLKHNILTRLKKGLTDFYCSAKCSGTKYSKPIFFNCDWCEIPCRTIPCLFNNNKNHFCSIKCREAKHSFECRFTTNCSECGKEIRRKNCEKKNKSGNYFCDKVCKGKFAMKNNLLNLYNKRSKAELFLTELISIHYPNLDIQLNNRTLLDGLEIDILLPDIKLAIELNGPFHYFPIRGKKSLELIQHKDQIKQDKTKDLNYNLIIIDISTLRDNQREQFLEKIFVDKIKKIIDSLI